jgi:hypothetical protein
VAGSDRPLSTSHMASTPCICRQSGSSSGLVVSFLHPLRRKHKFSKFNCCQIVCPVWIVAVFLVDGAGEFASIAAKTAGFK